MMNLNNKDVTIAFRVSEDFSRWLKDRAESSQISVSDYIRFVLEDHKRACDLADLIRGYQQTE